MADTVRSTPSPWSGDQMVARVSHLRDVVDRHARGDRRDGGSPPRLVHEGRRDAGSVERFRRRVPRQPAYWDGTCHIEGEADAGCWECRVLDISMFGLGLTLQHPAPSRLVGRRHRHRRSRGR